MISYKFLRSGAIGPFSGFAWPRPRGDIPGPWVHVDGGLVSCRHGIHACRLSDLPYWICDELWVIELEDAHALGHHVLARSGRLVERVSAWDPTAAAVFAEACTWRLRDRVAAALSAAGDHADAGALGACGTLDELRAVTANTTITAADGSTVPPAVRADADADLEHLVGYLADALSFGADGHTATVALIGAHVAARTDGGHDAERGLQATWFDELITAQASASQRDRPLGT